MTILDYATTEKIWFSQINASLPTTTIMLLAVETIVDFLRGMTLLSQCPPLCVPPLES